LFSNVVVLIRNIFFLRLFIWKKYSKQRVVGRLIRRRPTDNSGWERDGFNFDVFFLFFPVRPAIQSDVAFTATQHQNRCSAGGGRSCYPPKRRLHLQSSTSFSNRIWCSALCVRGQGGMNAVSSYTHESFRVGRDCLLAGVNSL
jgi:hypothetical protein